MKNKFSRPSLDLKGSDRNSHLRLILKTTRKCNLGCQYCLDRDNESMDFSMELMVELYKNILEFDRIKTTTLIWHGGEPLLLGIEFFKKNQYIQNKLQNNSKLFINSIQSNGTIWNAEWINFCSDYNYKVGISLDGPLEIHNKQRPMKDGDSYNRCLSTIKALQETNIPCGVLTVVTQPIIEFGPEKMWDFYKKNNINSYGLLSVRSIDNNASKLFDYNRKYGEFMAHMLRRWFEEDNKNLNIREFSGKLDLFFGLPHSLCTDGGPCVGKYFGIESDGSIHHCDKFMDDPRFLLGNIFSDSIEEIYQSEKYFKLLEFEKEIRANCADCQWFHLCGGGCLFELMTLLKNGGKIGTPDCIKYTIFNSMSEILSKSSTLLNVLINQAL